MTIDSGDLAKTWAETEASLPTGWELGGLRCASTGLTPEQRSEEWVAVASGPDGQEVHHQAVDPIAVLQGLAALVPGADR
jgi:hypothetical protein